MAAVSNNPFQSLIHFAPEGAKRGCVTGICAAAQRAMENYKQTQRPASRPLSVGVILEIRGPQAQVYNREALDEIWRVAERALRGQFGDQTGEALKLFVNGAENVFAPPVSRTLREGDFIPEVGWFCAKVDRENPFAASFAQILRG